MANVKLRCCQPEKDILVEKDQQKAILFKMSLNNINKRFVDLEESDPEKAKRPTMDEKITCLLLENYF